MIEQLPETVILLEHLRHRAHHAQFTACAAARANLAQGGFDPCLPCHAAPDADQHQQGKGDQREHPRPCGQVSNARVRKSQHSFRIAETFLDGLITNDKFCFTRHRQLHLNWWRRPLRLRQSPLLNISLAHSGESHDTAVEHPAAGRGAQRRSAPPRSSLSTPSAMGAGTIHRTPDAGGEP